MHRPQTLRRFLPVILLAAPFLQVSSTMASTATWRIVPSPSSGSLAGVAAISSANAWAVGSGPQGTLIEHWNGTQWSVVASPNVGTSINFLSGVAAVSASDIWAVGQYYDGVAYEPLTEHWNGSRWSVVASPKTPGDGLNGVAFVSSSDGWAVGGGQGALTLRWNGSKWSTVSNPDAGTSGATLRTVTAISSSNVLAAGYVRSGYHSRVALVEQWNGRSWSALSTPPTASGSASLYGIATDRGHAWAVGGQQLDERTLAERWNGTTWSIVSTPDAGPSNDFLAAVATLSPSDAWAVGQIVYSSQTLVEHWNGTTWSSISAPSPAGLPILSGAAALAGGTVWAVGGFYPAAGGQEQTLILETTNG